VVHAATLKLIPSPKLVYVGSYSDCKSRVGDANMCDNDENDHIKPNSITLAGSELAPEFGREPASSC